MKRPEMMAANPEMGMTELSPLRKYRCHQNIGRKVGTDSPAACCEFFSDRSLVIPVGAAWKELSEDDKAPFVALSNEDKERYAAEMEKYDEPEAKAAREVRNFNTSNLSLLVVPPVCI